MYLNILAPKEAFKSVSAYNDRAITLKDRTLILNLSAANSIQYFPFSVEIDHVSIIFQSIDQATAASGIITEALKNGTRYVEISGGVSEVLFNS